LLRTIQTEFPDYDVSTLPVIPAGFVDESWHNEACPRFDHPALRLSLWIDYADPAQRELPEARRFYLQRCDEDWCGLEDLADTDDWAVVLKAIEDEQQRHA
jgi:hypothetical protein